MAQIQMQNVTKRYGSFLAVDHIDLSVEDREFLVLVGPSGCGKSTTLRMIAGLEDLTEGEIHIGDRNVTFLPPKDRDIAMVFQNYALYPHMNVYKNMSFGLQIQKFPKKEIDERVKEAATILGIEELINRKPKELSGGQRQRVAMGRAIVRKPQAFLFDEPLSNLDAILRVQMRGELAKLHHRLQKTVVYVTHDQIEALTLATRIVVMNQGQIMQIGQPLEVYNHPQNLFVAGFIGSPAMNLLQAQVLQKEDEIYLKGKAFELAIPGALRQRFQKLKDTNVIFGIRPEHITDQNVTPQFPGGERLQVTVDVSECVGSETILITSCGPDSITARVGPQCSVGPETPMELTVDMNRMYLFDETTGESY